MYQVKANEKFNFAIKITNDLIEVDDEVIEVNQIRLNDNCTHVLYKNKSYQIEIVEFIKEDKLAIIKVNGNIYKISIADQYDKLLKQLGLDNLAASKILQLKAPMPGLVLSILVNEGDEIKKGDNILVLEAMKMENMIKSPTDGVIKKITINQGDKVEKNELLISFS